MFAEQSEIQNIIIEYEFFLLAWPGFKSRGEVYSEMIDIYKTRIQQNNRKLLNVPIDEKYDLYSYLNQCIIETLTFTPQISVILKYQKDIDTYLSLKQEHLNIYTSKLRSLSISSIRKARITYYEFIIRSLELPDAIKSYVANLCVDTDDIISFLSIKYPEDVFRNL